MNHAIRQAITKVLRKHTQNIYEGENQQIRFETIHLPLQPWEESKPIFTTLKALSHEYLIHARGDAQNVYGTLTGSQKGDRATATKELLGILQEALSDNPQTPHSDWIEDLANLRIDLPQSFFFKHINNTLFREARGCLREQFLDSEKAPPRSIVAHTGAIQADYPLMLELSLKITEGRLTFEAKHTFKEPSQQLQAGATLKEQLRWRTGRLSTCSYRLRQLMKKWASEENGLFQKQDRANQDLEEANEIAQEILQELTPRKRALLKKHSKLLTDKL